MPRPSRTAFVVAILVALVTAGCGAGDDDLAADRTTTTTTTTTPAGTTDTTPETALQPETQTTLDLDTAAPPEPASTPEALAEQIATADAAVRNPNAPPESVADSGHVLQVAYKKLALTPDWNDAVMSALPPELDPVAAANSRAQWLLRSMIKPRDSLPDWRIVAPAPRDELIGYYKSAEAEFGVPWAYLAAIHLVETRMGRIRGTSEAGAQGPMQFMPATWEAYGEGDINSNADAIRAAARYLKRNGAPDDMRNALWNYNHSDRYVEAVTLYAEQMRADEARFNAYYHFQVYYLTTSGDMWLPVGWTKAG